MDPLTEINRNTFDQLRLEMGADFMPELAAAFCEDSNQLIVSMFQSLDANDAAAFTRHAHSLKSTSITFGALNFSALARQLEQLGKEGRLDQSSEIIQHLSAALPDLQTALKELCNE